MAKTMTSRTKAQEGARWLAFASAAFAALLGQISVACYAGELTGASTVVDPYVVCVRLLAFDVQFEDISNKLPLYDMSAVSFGMLADSSLPNTQERKEILAWFDKWDRCWKDNEALHQSQWPADIFQLFQEENAEIRNIGIDLYNRKITFGEANKRVQDYGVKFRERVAAAVKQYQTEIAEQRAEAERQAERRQEAADRVASQQQAYELAQEQAAAADRQRRAQLLGNFLSGMAQQMRDVAQARQMRQPTLTNCFTSGGNTSCVSQ
jgi:hypothetical protein